MWQTYYQPTVLADALELLREHASHARVVAGATDVLVERLRGAAQQPVIIDISRVEELRYGREANGLIHLGALATHNDVIASTACVRGALPLAQACHEVGAPQIRTRATIAGNLVTASPANDTITPLLALDAELLLASADGERVIPLREFYTGFRRSQILPGELLREIRFAALRDNQRGIFLKLGLRRAQAISVLNLAVVLSFEGDVVSEARIALGCLAPTVVRAPGVEAFLLGKTLDDAACAEAGQVVQADIAPIDDLRGTASYRRAALANMLADALRRLAAGQERSGWQPAPVLLDTGERAPVLAAERGPLSNVATTINNAPYQLGAIQHKTLLDALREDAGLTGAKEGCAEGECGACTVWLNGQAVMACLTPAAQAHGAHVTTIEGLSSFVHRPPSTVHRSRLHPLQQSFIDCAAVQCGFCIPGMIMAGAKLLDEQPAPDVAQIQSALSGNICRCTGYRKIFDAVQAASTTLLEQ